MLKTILLIFVCALNVTNQSRVFKQVGKEAQFNSSYNSGKTTLLVPDTYLKVQVQLIKSAPGPETVFTMTFGNCSSKIYMRNNHYYIKGVKYDFPITIEVEPFGSIYPPEPELQFLPYEDNTEVIWIINSILVSIIAIFCFLIFTTCCCLLEMERKFKKWNKRLQKTYEERVQEALDKLNVAQAKPAPLQLLAVAPRVQEQELLLTAIEKENDGLKTAILTPDVNVNNQPTNVKEESMKTGKEKKADAQTKPSLDAAKKETSVVSVDLAPK
ncbi:hypothetical protein M3Y96_01213300 [Aphelenchoides besseyi]|nr:hypothetical protein M3Y96_01213300 [Aphelenchoides besseyi]